MLRFDTARQEINQNVARGALLALYGFPHRVASGDRARMDAKANDVWTKVLAGDKAAWYEMKACGITVWNDDEEVGA